MWATKNRKKNGQKIRSGKKAAECEKRQNLLKKEQLYWRG
jgi:hypothetical protein